MKKIHPLFTAVLLLSITSCYVYRPYVPPTPEQIAKAEEQQKISQEMMDQQMEKDLKRKKEIKDNAISKDISLEQKEKRERELKMSGKMGGDNGLNQNKEATNIPQVEGPKGIILPNKIYKVTVADKIYKLQADKWVGDTLVSHQLRNPDKVYKFKDTEITEIQPRRFSKIGSDGWTVMAYGGAAVLLLILL